MREVGRWHWNAEGFRPMRKSRSVWWYHKTCYTGSGNTEFLSIGHRGSNFSEISNNIQKFSFMKLHFKILPAKCQPFCPDAWCTAPWNRSQLKNGYAQSAQPLFVYYMNFLNSPRQVQWLQIWFEILRSAFKTGLPLVKQFAHITLLPDMPVHGDMFSCLLHTK